MRTLDSDYFKTCPRHGAGIDDAAKDARAWLQFLCGCDREQFVPDTCPWCGAKRETGPYYRFVTYTCTTWITEGGVVHRGTTCLRAQIKTFLDRIEMLERETRLRHVLNDIYPMLAGRVTQLQEAGETVAAERWNALCTKVMEALGDGRDCRATNVIVEDDDGTP